VVVIGGGPVGVVAAARLGARTALLTRDELGGMAAHDGPVPVRTLAHAARLIREARQLETYGVSSGDASLDYSRLLARVREVTGEVGRHSTLRGDLGKAGVTIHEHAGTVRFSDPHQIETAHAPALRAEKFIICTGGVSRQLALARFDLTCTHSEAWALSSVPPSMVVIGAGATGVQVASIFSAFGSHVTLFEAAPRILMTEDPDVAATVAAALRASGIQVIKDAGKIDGFEPCAAGVRLTYSKNGARRAHRGGGRGGRGRMGRQHRGAQPLRRGRRD
jgi:pyruvate/2-oxoglutarate dehydrogenase complex dihydrolipoamide dehydrogenase (E3) component